MKTNSGLVTWVKKSYARGDWYLNGGYFDRIVTLEYIMEKARQYPKRYTPEYIERSKKSIGKYAGDCVCFVKAYIWTDNNGIIRYPADPKIKAETDINVDDAFNKSPLKGPISTIPEIPGVCVYYKGHMGIYIGEGYVIEARGVDYGVVKTKLTSRGWTDWFYYPGIVYEEDIMYLEKGVKSEEVGVWQRYLKSKGYNLGNFGLNKDGIDNSFGGTMVTVQAKWEQDNKRTVDSKVDLSDCLFALDKISNELLTANTLLGKERERVMFLDAEIAERQSRLSKAEAECADKDQKNAQLTIIIEDNMDTLKQKDDEIARLAISAELLTKEVENHKAVGLALSREITAVTEQLHAVEAELKAIKEAPPVVEEPVEYSTKELLHMLIDSIFKK